MDVNVQVRIINRGPPNTGDDIDEDADELRPQGLCHVTLYQSLRYRPLYSLFLVVLGVIRDDLFYLF